LLGTLTLLSAKPSHFEAQTVALVQFSSNKEQPAVSMFEVMLPVTHACLRNPIPFDQYPNSFISS